jgi:hypothetical protein
MVRAIGHLGMTVLDEYRTISDGNYYHALAFQKEGTVFYLVGLLVSNSMIYTAFGRSKLEMLRHSLQRTEMHSSRLCVLL